MYCGKCGAQNEDGVRFCGSCGAALEQPVGGEGGSTVGKSTGMGGKEKKIGIAVVGVAAILVIILACSLFGGRGYKSTVKKYMKAVTRAEYEDILDLLPKELKAKEDYEEMEEELEDAAKKTEDFMKEYKIDYKIQDDKDIKGDELEEIRKEYEEEFDIKVKAAKEVEVKLHIKYDGESVDNTMTVDVIKVGGSWYLDVMNFDFIF